jgi:hypothetical protein
VSDFDPDKYLAAKRGAAAFNPDEYLARAKMEQAKPAAKSGGPSGLSALGLGAAQGATLGFGDEVGGAIQALGRRFLPESLGGGGERDRGRSLAELYREERDGFRRDNLSAEASRPGAYFAGNVLGGLGTAAALPGAGVKTGLQALKAGAGLGAAGSLGASGADLSRGEVGGALLDTTLGTGLGAVTGGGGFAAMKVAPTVLRKARQKLEEVAVRQGRRVLTSGADSLSSRAPVSGEAVKEAISSGGILPFGTTSGAFKRIERKAGDLGKVYGEIIETLEARGVRGPVAAEVADEIVKRGAAIEPNTMIPAIPREYLRQATELVGKAGNSPTLGLRQAEELKRSLQHGAKFDRLKASPLEGAKRDIASIVREANETAIERAGRANPGTEIAELAENFVPVKQRLGRLIEAREAARRGNQRSLQRRGVGMSDMMAAGTGAAASGGLGGAALLGTLNKLARERGTSAVASGAYGASQLAKTLSHAALLSPGRGGAGAGGALAVERAMLPEWLRDAEQEALIQALRGGR